MENIDDELVELSTNLDERGLVASEDIPLDVLILHIPAELLLFGSNDIPNICDIDKCAIFIYLEYFKGEDSDHIDFISMLPDSFDSTVKANADLMPEDIQEELKKLDALIDVCQGKFIERYPDHPLDIDLFRWAYMNVNTRCVSVESRIGMAPLFDFLNHSIVDQNARVGSGEEEGLMVFATRDIAKGEQVLLKLKRKDLYKIRTSRRLDAGRAIWLHDWE
jgi:hypothetical protein